MSSMTELPGEFELIEHIRASLKEEGEALIKGIGDDCAIGAVRPGFQLLSTIDALVEDVHFRRSYITPHQLGHKAMAVNLSDIAAMGGIPRYALISICIPRDVNQEYIDELYEGMSDVAAFTGAAIAGGNISSSPGGLVINVVLLGEVEEGKALLRSGARPGDVLMVTGELGLSAAGVELLNKRDQAPPEAKEREPRLEAVYKHLTPVPRVREGRRLLASGCVTAAIDLSDGLASDLRHLCNESSVGAIIYSEMLPAADALKKLQGDLSKPLSSYALSGGEDYELLIAVEKEGVKGLKSNWPGALAPVTEVGVVTEREKGIVLLDEKGNASELQVTGWDHLGTGKDASKKP